LNEPLLQVDRLTVAVGDGGSAGFVVNDLSFEVARGEFVGLTGESGSGKTLTALSVLGLLPAAMRICRGSVRLAGVEVLDLSEKEMRKVRGGRVGMVFQDPLGALNPVLTIGHQISEVMRAHRRIERREAMRESARLLDLVAMPDIQRVLREYPAQLSGGQRQRAMIAIALAAGPDLLIADEPTTALDVTVQAQILELLEILRDSMGLAVLLITHDLAVVAETCDRVVVLLEGRSIEEAPTAALFSRPAHPYTREVLRRLPRLGDRSSVARQFKQGARPSSSALPGCAYSGRCSDEVGHCATVRPRPTLLGSDHYVSCHLHSFPEQQ
jgi:peptide/nickel transport system ATP-binding protein